MTRSIKCRDQQNFLKVKKLEVEIIFFNSNPHFAFFILLEAL